MTATSSAGKRPPAHWFLRLSRGVLHLLLFPLFIVLVALTPKRRRRLMWGPIPIANYKYWSAAMREVGWESQTFMRSWFDVINARSDFDLYFDDLFPRFLRDTIVAALLRPYVAFLYITRHASVLHLPYTGGPLGSTVVWRAEAHLLRMAGIRTVVLAHGADVYMYSRVVDLTARHGLLLSYPQEARDEWRIERRVRYWARHADIILGGLITDGLGRWDALIGNFVTIDTKVWQEKSHYSHADGRNGQVRILHAPNHLCVTGTEFFVQAVERVRNEGLDVELVLMERMKNDEIRALMQHVDIFADQLVLPGYGLAAIEAMASGLPVLSDLSNEVMFRVFRRYTYFGECPIVSTTIESITDNLRVLVTRPDLRQRTGTAGRSYVERYHSPETARYVFGAVYDRLLNGKDVDQMNLFHPLTSPYRRPDPQVASPV
jgi:glycosyltransferase involved in cell wall biosynthesis